MTISQELLGILACPVCKTEIKLIAEGKGLECISCHRIYPIRDGIPVMLIDEATIATSVGDSAKGVDDEKNLI